MITYPGVSRCDESKDVNAMSNANTARIMSHIQRQAQQIIQMFLYEPNNQRTRNSLSESLTQLMRSFSSSSAIDDFNVKVKSIDEITNEFTYPYDPLTKSCNTYSEYRLKKAVISGDSDVMPEDEFLRQHSFDENNDLNVDIQIKPQKTAQYINLSFKAS